MLPGPIFRHELKSAARPRGLFVVRTVLGLLLAGVVILSALGPFGWDGIGRDVYEARELHVFGGLVFIALLAIEVVFTMPAALAMVSPAIAEEREKDTLPLLLLTRLSRVEIVLTKLIGRLVPSIYLVLVGFPLAAGCAWCAGLPALVLIEALVILMSTTIVVGGFAILASARRDRVGTARAQAMTWAFLWFMIVPLCSIIPVRPGTIWGDLAMELQRVCGWIAPSSPLSLATRHGWFIDRNVHAFTEQVVVMLVLQAGLLTLAIVGAASALRLRERHPFASDPHQGFRPPVSDDPIFWKEYTLPLRGARRPLIVMQARQIVILIRILVALVFQLLIMIVAVAVPVCLTIATVRYGYFAFHELARDGYRPAGPSPARDQFNYLIRWATGIVALVPLASSSPMTTAHITIERDKKTWDALLTTPLTGAEILSAKMRVGARWLWTSSRWVIPLWAAGILAGSVHPLTALLAALELPLAAWASLVLGVWLAVRPGSGLSTKANSNASWAALGLAASVGLTVLALLCSHRELVEFSTWDIRVRAIIVASILALPPLLGLLAWVLMRRTFCRFDEWVGRPHRGSDVRPRLKGTRPRVKRHPIS